MNYKQKSQYGLLRDWSQSSYGQKLLKLQNKELMSLLPRFHGMCMVEVSPFELDIEKQALSVQNIFKVKLPESPVQDFDVICEPDYLPFRENSVDILSLIHGLDIYDNPHQQLRDASRVIVPNGYLIIQGYNPVSLWGLGRLAMGWRKAMPWTSRFISPSRIKDWLTILDFHVESISYQGYFWPVDLKMIDIGFKPLEAVGSWVPNPFGASYTLVARKLVGGMTHIRPNRKVLIPKGVRVPSPSAKISGRVADRAVK